MPREKCWWLICALVFFDAVLAFIIPRGYLLTTIGNVTQCLLLAVVLVCLLANTRGADASHPAFLAAAVTGVCPVVGGAGAMDLL